MRVIVALLGLPALLLAASPAASADSDKWLGSIQKCRSVADDIHRLKCYDELARGIEASATEAKAERSERSADEFGLSTAELEKRAAATPDSSDDIVTSISSAIVELFTDAAHRRVFLLANGQVWRETSNSSMKSLLRTDDVVEIKRGGIGGFRLTSKGRSGFIGVSRVR